MKRKLALASAAAAALAGGIAFATIPDSAGEIHACYGMDGSLRVVEDASRCRPNEKTLTWSQARRESPAAQAWFRK